MILTRQVLTGVIAAASVFLASCSSIPSTVEVHGTVTLDGQPISSGSITMEDPADQLAPALGEITDGRYNLAVAPGTKRIRIVAARQSEKVDPEIGAHYYVSYIPEAYNSKTILTHEVRSGGPNEINFELKSRP